MPTDHIAPEAAVLTLCGKVNVEVLPSQGMWISLPIFAAFSLLCLYQMVI